MTFFYGHPTHRLPARTYLHQLCLDTIGSFEEFSCVIDDRERLGERERQREREKERALSMQLVVDDDDIHGATVFLVKSRTVHLSSGVESDSINLLLALMLASTI